ncbi:MAG: glycosyltransferase [Bacteroidota bacterium]
MNKFDIICLSFPAWDGNYVKSTVKLMSALAKSQRVVFVDYAYTWKDVLWGILGKNKYVPWKRVLGLQSRKRHVVLPQGSIQVLSLPPIVPINWTRSTLILKLLVKWNGWLIKKVLMRNLEKIDVYKPVVINALNPVYGNPLAGKLDERMLVYYCYDEIQAGNWMTKHGHAAEEEFLPKVDLVVTSAEKLRERKSAYHPNCFTVNNGVDLDMFMVHPDESTNSPNTGKPIIGYLGSVDHRLDVDLLDKLLKKFPHIDLHFVGRVTSMKVFKHFKQYPNVHFLGPQSPEKLASFLKTFEVGIIPFLKNDFTEGIYPMKINEYLAAGLPVVSTRFGDMNTFEDIANICDTPHAFLEALELCLDSGSTSIQKMERIHFAQENTWEKRAEEFLRILYKELGAKYGREEILREGVNI